MCGGQHRSYPSSSVVVVVVPRSARCPHCTGGAPRRVCVRDAPPPVTLAAAQQQQQVQRAKSSKSRGNVCASYDCDLRGSRVFSLGGDGGEQNGAHKRTEFIAVVDTHTNAHTKQAWLSRLLLAPSIACMHGTLALARTHTKQPTHTHTLAQCARRRRPVFCAFRFYCAARVLALPHSCMCECVCVCGGAHTVVGFVVVADLRVHCGRCDSRRTVRLFGSETGHAKLARSLCLPFSRLSSSSRSNETNETSHHKKKTHHRSGSAA